MNLKQFFRTLLRLPVPAAGLAILASCSTEPYDVWLCGILGDGTAVYWINGEQHTLESPGGEAIPYDMAVVGDDVYVAGQLKPKDLTKQPYAAYWHNGKIHLLTDGRYMSCAKAVTVTDAGDVITVGYAYDGPVTRTRSAKFTYIHRRMSVAKCWKNDTELYSLTDGKLDASCEDVIMYGQDILLVGYDREQNRFEHFVDTYYRRPGIWLNGKPGGKSTPQGGVEPFHDGCGAFYTACYNGIDLRLAGYSDHNLESYGYNACYWDADGWEKKLPDSHDVRITGSCTDLSDWYLCGTNDKGEAIYWKNGQSVKLTQYTADDSHLNSSANAIAVLHENVYVAGSLQGWGGYWRNGKFQPLEIGVENVVDIYVREKQK